MNEYQVGSGRPFGVKVWDRLQVRLKTETSPLLGLEKFVVQRDAFARLSDDDVTDEGAPFLSYSYSGGTSDTDLPFSIDLYPYDISLQIGPANVTVAYVDFSYGANILRTAEADSLPPKADSVAKHIILAVKLMLNGQLAVGLNVSGRRVDVTEVFLMGVENYPLPTLFHAHFGALEWRAKEYILLQNRVYTEHVPVAKSFPLIPPIVNGERVNRGRKVESIYELEPLSRKQATELGQSWLFHEGLAKEPGKSLFGHLYRTSIFWFVTIGFLGIALLLILAPVTAPFFGSAGGYIILLVGGRLGITYLSSFLIAKRQQKIERGERSLTFEFEKLFHRDRA